MRTEYPRQTHIPMLRALWKEAFGDNDLFLDAFFTHGFSADRCRCIVEKDRVLSALYWFEVTYSRQRFAYLYAVATAADCRGRGLFSALLQDVKQILAAEGYAGILLVPESETLCRMYEKFGFSACCTVDQHCVSAADAPVVFREIGISEFALLRRKLLPEGGVVQEGALLTFLASQCRFWAGEGWLAVGQIHEGKLICREFLGDSNAMAGLLRALNVPRGAFRTPGNTTPFAWFLPLRAVCEPPAYFALALD